MRPVFPIVACLLLISACGAPLGRDAEEASASAYDKVGFIDMARIMRETSRGRQVGAQLADAERQVISRLSDIQAQLDTISDDLDEARAAEEPNLERVAELAAEYRATAEEGQQIESLARQQLDEYRTELSLPLVEDVYELCETIGRSENFGLIVDRVGLAYADTTVDLTDRVISEIGGGGASGALIDEALRAPGEGHRPNGAPADPEDPGDAQPESVPPSSP